MPADNQNQIQKEIEEKLFPHTKFGVRAWKVFIFEAFFFSLTLIFGIVSALKLNKVLKVEKITLPPISFSKFILYFILATLFILLISRFLRLEKEKGIIFKIIFIFVSLFGGMLALGLWLGDFLTLILMAILILWWLKKPLILIHNLIITFGLAGIGSSLGLQLSPQVVVLLLIIFSIYDFIAVYKTKHMIKMAKEMIETGTILGLIIPSKISDFKASLKEVRPGGRFLILGGGDIAFPLLFCVSLIPSGILNSLIVALFSLIGLSAGFWFFITQKTRRPIPALPLIALFSIIGFLITLIFK